MRSGAPVLTTAAVIGALVAASCGSIPSTPTEPAPRDPLALGGHVSATSISPGDRAVATFTLTNVSTRAVTVGFPSSCDVLPYVRERQTQRLVHPSGGGYGCAAIVTNLTLEPGQSMVRTMQIASTGRGVTSAVASVVDLLPGDYNFYAEAAGSVDGRAVILRSDTLQFSVK